MENITSIEQLSTYDKEIRLLALKVCKNDKNLADEITQEFYIAYLKKCPEVINKFYIWSALNNQYLSIKRKEKVRRNYNDLHPVDESKEDEEYDYEIDEIYQGLSERVMKIIDSFKFLDRELYKLNKFGKMSVRKISEGTDIPEKTIRFAINKVHKRLLSESENNKDI